MRRIDHRILALLVLAIVVSASCTVGRLACAAEEPSLRELADESRRNAARNQETIVREILSRQKGDQLKVYLKGSRIYVNGKSVSQRAVSTVVLESGLKHSIIIAAPSVHDERVTEVSAFLQKYGIKSVEISSSQPTLRELATASRKEAARKTETTLRQILSRQKGDQLSVYLKGSRTYVNGKQISIDLLPAILRASGLEEATINATAGAEHDRVIEVKRLLRKNGAALIDASKAK